MKSSTLRKGTKAAACNERIRTRLLESFLGHRAYHPEMPLHSAASTGRQAGTRLPILIMFLQYYETTVIASAFDNGIQKLDHHRNMDPSQLSAVQSSNQYSTQGECHM
jgi:hypothetical protein